MVQQAPQKNGRLDFIALKNHYEGVEVHDINIVQAEKLLQDLSYAGEKNPHMWWDEFERQLTDQFNTYDHHERRNVYLDNKKLLILNRKVNADLLQATNASINLEITKNPVTLNYDDKLTEFRNQVNQKFLPELSSPNNRRTRIVNKFGS